MINIAVIEHVRNRDYYRAFSGNPTYTQRVSPPALVSTDDVPEGPVLDRLYVDSVQRGVLQVLDNFTWADDPSGVLKLTGGFKCTEGLFTDAALTVGVVIDLAAAATKFLVQDTGNNQVKHRSPSGVLSDIGAQASLTFGILNGNSVVVDSSTVNSGEYARFTASGLQSLTAAELAIDIGLDAKQDTLTFGILNTNTVVIDSADVNSGEYAKFTASGLQGKTIAELKDDLDLTDYVSKVAMTDNRLVRADGVNGEIQDSGITIDNSNNITGVAALTATTLTASSIAHETTDVDKFIVSNAGLFKYRTGAEILSDIGGTGNAGTVTSVAALTLGTTGTDLNSSVANGTTTPVITLNVPTASAANRGVLSTTDWSTFNDKQNALTFGIANGNSVVIDHASIADNDYAKFTASGLEGRSYAEVLSDIGAASSSITLDDVTTNGATTTNDIEIGDLTLAGGSQNYLFTDNGVSLALQSQTSGSPSVFEIFSKDGDGTDLIRNILYGIGTPNSITNRERLIIEWNDVDSYDIWTEADGTGILRPLVLYTEGNTNQLKLNTDGSNFMSGVLTVNTITNSTGDFLTAPTNGGLITQRTAVQVLSDIGGASSSGAYVALDATMTDNRLVRAHLGDGEIQDSGITIDDSDNITGIAILTATNGVINGSLAVGHTVAITTLHVLGTIRSENISATSNGYNSLVTGDANHRFEIEIDGKIGWGSGSATRDVFLYRNAANELKTDDNFTVVGTLTAASGVFASGGGTCLTATSISGWTGRIYNANGTIVSLSHSDGYGVAVDTNITTASIYLFKGVSNSIVKFQVFNDGDVYIHKSLDIGRIAGQSSITASSTASSGHLILSSYGTGNIYLNNYNSNDVFLSAGGGKTIVGTTTDNGAYKFQVNGDSFFTGNVITEGYFLADGEVTAHSTSDLNLKRIKGEIQNPLALIKGWKMYEFYWNDLALQYTPHKNTTTKHYGAGAQDFLKHNPELVHDMNTKHELGRTLGMEYKEFGPIAIAAINQLAVKVETNEQKILRLENEVKELKENLYNN